MSNPSGNGDYAGFIRHIDSRRAACMDRRKSWSLVTVSGGIEKRNLSDGALVVGFEQAGLLPQIQAGVLIGPGFIAIGLHIYVCYGDMTKASLVLVNEQWRYRRGICQMGH